MYYFLACTQLERNVSYACAPENYVCSLWILCSDLVIFCFIVIITEYKQQLTASVQKNKMLLAKYCYLVLSIPVMCTLNEIDEAGMLTLGDIQDGCLFKRNLWVCYRPCFSDISEVAKFTISNNLVFCHFLGKAQFCNYSNPIRWNIRICEALCRK